MPSLKVGVSQKCREHLHLPFNDETLTESFDAASFRKGQVLCQLLLIGTLQRLGDRPATLNGA